MFVPERCWIWCWEGGCESEEEGGKEEEENAEWGGGVEHIFRD